MSTTANTFSTDAFGVCITEAQLDAPETWMNKGAHVPRTCLPLTVDKSEEVLEQALGHTPSYAEWTNFSLSWCRVTGECHLSGGDTVIHTPEVPSVPLPGGVGYMVIIAVVFVIAALFKHGHHNEA